MSKIYWETCRVKLGELKPWERNPRQSTKAQAKRILKSFSEFGQVHPVIIGPNNEVYDGHQRLSALLTLHGADYEVDARRSSRELSEEERERLVLALHNATGSWDWDALSGFTQDETLIEWGFDDEFMAQLKSSIANMRDFMDASGQSERYSFLPDPSVMKRKPLQESVDETVHNVGQEGPTQERPTQSHDTERFPLAIVLGLSEYRKWQAFKEKIGARSDKDAFVELLNAIGDLL